MANFTDSSKATVNLNGSNRDASEYDEAADNATPIDVLEPTTDHHAKLMQEITAGIVCMLIDSRNPRVRIVAIAIAFNLPSTLGQSTAVWAKRCKVTKQRLNKEVIAMRAKYSLPALGGAWTEQARAGYRQTCHKVDKAQQYDDRASTKL